MAFSEILTTNRVRAWAGARAYGRGEGYFHGGHVSDLKACRKAKPDPEALAERLFDWELNGEWSTFRDAVNSHGRVLGKNGIRRYHELAETEWGKVKPLQPGEAARDKYGKRSRITHIMENLALQSGDIEALVAVMSRDLSSSYGFFKIAEVYRKARKSNKALEWAEKGIQIFDKKADRRLQDLLAELYHRRKRHDEAISSYGSSLKSILVCRPTST